MKMEKFLFKCLSIIAALLAIRAGYSEDRASFQNCPCWAKPNKLDFFADLLLWNLQETCTGWAFEVDPMFTTGKSLPPFAGNFDATLAQVTFDWKLGLRTGLGYTLDHDLWDTRLYYTWFHTTSSDYLEASPGNVIQSQFIGSEFLLAPPVAPFLNPIFNKAAIKWSVLYSMFNWELGRMCQISKTLSFRPFLGLQGGEINQHIHAIWEGTNFNAFEKMKHNFWGIGPTLGINTKWYLVDVNNHSFIFFGDFAPAFLWGNWTFDEVVKTSNNFVTDNTLPDRKMGSFVLQGMAGLAWKVCYNHNRSSFSLKLGYEMQVWTEHLQFFHHFSGILHNALIIQGGTFRFIFKF
jgi:hypothetical protein